MTCADDFDAADHGDLFVDVDEVELLRKLEMLRAADLGFERRGHGWVTGSGGHRTICVTPT